MAQPARPVKLEVQVAGEGWTINGADGRRRIPNPLGVGSLLSVQIETLAAARARGAAELAPAIAAAATAVGETLSDLLGLAGRAQLLAAIRAGGATLLLRFSGPDAALEAALGLPWALLVVDGAQPVRAGRLGLAHSVARAPKQAAAPRRRLEVGVVVAAPVDQSSLDYEQEAQRLIEVLHGHSAHFTELGTLDELAELVEQRAPTVLHFSGHGSTGGLAFEDAIGVTDQQPIEAVLRRLGSVHARRPRLLVLSACHSASLVAACQQAGLAHVVGFAGPVVDRLATQAEVAMYAALAAGATLAEAVSRGQAALDEAAEHDPAAWAQLVLFSARPTARLVDPQAPAGPAARVTRPAPIPGLPEVSPTFVGRRQMRHLLRRRRRDGATLFVLQGLGGLGKTALAAHLLHTEFSTGDPADVLVLRVQDAEDGVAGLATQAAQFGESRVPGWASRMADLGLRYRGRPASRFEAIVRDIRAARPQLVIYADNVERLQVDLDAPGADLSRWRSPLGRDWWAAMERLSEGGVVLASARYRWQGLDAAAHIPIPRLSTSDARRLSRQLPGLGALSAQDQKWLAAKTDGRPRTLLGLDALIRTRPPATALRAWLLPMLEGVGVFDDDLVLSRLWATLPPEAQAHAVELGELRRPAPAPVVDALGDHRAALLDASVLGCTYVSVPGRAPEPRWSLHRVVQPFVRAQGAPSTASIEAAALAYTELAKRGGLAYEDVAEGVMLYLRLGDPAGAWALLEPELEHTFEHARYEDCLRWIDQICQVGHPTGDTAAGLELFAARCAFRLTEWQRVQVRLGRAEACAESRGMRAEVMALKAKCLNIEARHQEAITCLQVALGLGSARVGEGVLTTLPMPDLLMEMAIAKAGLGDDDAELFLKEAGRVAAQIHGVGHPKHEGARISYAAWLFGQNRVGEAREMVESSLAELATTVVGLQSPDYARGAALLTAITAHQGSSALLVAFLARTKATAARSLGHGSRGYNSHLFALANVLATDPRFAEPALALLDEVVELEGKIESSSVDLGLSLLAIAVLLGNRDRERSVPSGREAHRMLKQHLGSKHEATRQARRFVLTYDRIPRLMAGATLILLGWWLLC